MKIRCQREKFLPLFSLVSSFCSTKDVRPALQNVKLIVDESKVTLMATDGEVGGRGEISVSDGFVVEQAGEAILPTKIFKRILAETTDAEFQLEVEGALLVVKGAHFRYQLNTLGETEKFPVVAPFSESTYFKVSSKSLCDLIRRTVFATDTNNSRYELRGVKFIFDEDRVSAVATDGRRLAYQFCACDVVGATESTNGVEAIFPPRTLNLLERAASDVEFALISIKGAQAFIQLGSFVVSTTLMVGRFPDWKSIIPDKSGKRRVDFIAGELARAIRQAEIVATENKPGVWFNFTKGKVNVAAAGEATGESSVDIPIAYDGDDEKLRLDSRFLNDFFHAVGEEETVAFYFLQDYRTLFETTDAYQYVVMQLA